MQPHHKYKYSCIINIYKYSIIFIQKYKYTEMSDTQARDDAPRLPSLSGGLSGVCPVLQALPSSRLQTNNLPACRTGGNNHYIKIEIILL